MIIINENYRIESDECCFTLKERKVAKSGKTEGEERWESIAYSRDLSGALMSYRNRRIKALSATDTDEKIENWISSIGELDESFIASLKGLEVTV